MEKRELASSHLIWKARQVGYNGGGGTILEVKKWLKTQHNIVVETSPSNYNSELLDAITDNNL